MSRADGRALAVAQIVNNGPASRRFNIVILGDGFAAGDQLQFERAAQNITDALFRFAPFNGRVKNAINVFRVNVESTDSGIDDPVACGGTGATFRTFFDGRFCNQGIQRLPAVDDSLAWDTALHFVPQAHVVLVLLNSTIWAGGGGSVATCSLAAGAEQIAIHELGHSAFGLADEYGYYSGCESGETDRNVHPVFFWADLAQPNVTLNTDANALMANKWGRFVTDTPMSVLRNPDCTICNRATNTFPAGTVGLFEGADYYHCNAFRPEFNCMMRNAGSSYCKVCNETIQKRLDPFIPIPLNVLQNFELIFISKNSGKVLDVTGISTNNGAAIQQWDWLKGNNQKWRIVNLSADRFKISSVNSGKVLDVAGVSSTPGAGVVQWDWHGGNNQQWHIDDIGEGYCRLVAVNSGQALDVNAASRNNGAGIIQWPWNNGDNQKWRVSTIELGMFVKLNGKALDVSGPSRNNGGMITQFDWHGGENQQWRLEYVGEGYFKIISAFSGKVLDVQGRNILKNTAIQQWDWHGGENQQWRVEHVSNGFYKITARHSGLCLHVGSNINSTPVIQQVFANEANQLWRIAPTP